MNLVLMSSSLYHSDVGVTRTLGQTMLQMMVNIYESMWLPCKCDELYIHNDNSQTRSDMINKDSASLLVLTTGL